MFYDATWLDAAGRLLIVGFFLAAGLFNLAPHRIRDHIERMAAFGTPWAGAAFWTGIALQFGGCALILANWHADVGVMLLIVFTVAATWIFHRYWRMTDPMRRNVSRVMLLNNTGLLGGLLLLLQNVR
jgi:uncharacterized membrane protein YphA (DoxX/SURF4 family)